MLVIKRRIGEKIRVKLPDGSDIWVVLVLGHTGGTASIGIEAPRVVSIAREETLSEAERMPAIKLPSRRRLTGRMPPRVG